MKEDRPITITTLGVPYLVCPYILVVKYCADVAIIFSYLELQGRTFEKRGTLTEGGYFYKRYENIAARCNINIERVKKYVKLLEKEGYLKTTFSRRGGINTKHYKVDLDFLKSQEYEYEEELREKEKNLVEKRNGYIKKSRNKELNIKDSKDNPKDYEFFVEYQNYMFNQENEKI